MAAAAPAASFSPKGAASVMSILLHVYEDSGLGARLTAACALARALEGHVTCLHAEPFADSLTADSLAAAILPGEFGNKILRRRAALQQGVEAELRLQHVSWDWHHIYGGMGDALIGFAALSDFVVLSQAGPSIEKDDPRPLAADVAIGARTPVLAVPESGVPFDPVAPALVAWNDSVSAGNALRWALPLLRLSREVGVLSVGDGVTAEPALRYLERHGLEAVSEQKDAGGPVAGTILAAAGAVGAGLIVMGAYGHSRLRELILGGTTRAVLRDATLPLLIAH